MKTNHFYRFIFLIVIFSACSSHITRQECVRGELCNDTESFIAGDSNLLELDRKHKESLARTLLTLSPSDQEILKKSEKEWLDDLNFCIAKKNFNYFGPPKICLDYKYNLQTMQLNFIATLKGFGCILEDTWGCISIANKLLKEKKWNSSLEYFKSACFADRDADQGESCYQAGYILDEKLKKHEEAIPFYSLSCQGRENLMACSAITKFKQPTLTHPWAGLYRSMESVLFIEALENHKVRLRAKSNQGYLSLDFSGVVNDNILVLDNNNGPLLMECDLKLLVKRQKQHIILQQGDETSCLGNLAGKYKFIR